MIFENQLILPQISENVDLSWNTKSEQQMTQKSKLQFGKHRTG